MAEQEPAFMESPAEGEPPFISGAELRSAFDAPDQEGVWGATDLRVTAGAGVSVDVGAGVAFVRGDDATDQGLYRVRNDGTLNSADFELGGIGVADATNPRIDQIIARILDDTHDSSGERKWRLEVLQGTATGGATLDNRSGAPALPNSCLRLADVLVPAGASSLLTANIRDRRPWARGAYYRYFWTGFDLGLTTSYAGLGLGGPLAPRLEIVSGLVAVKLRGAFYGNSAGKALQLQARVDGAMSDGLASGGGSQYFYTEGNLRAENFDFDLPVACTPGSHVFGMYAKESAAEVVIRASTTWPLVLEVEEITRPSAQNA